MYHTLTIHINMSNVAFDSVDSGAECAHILRELADKIEDTNLHEKHSFILFDVNGNKAGVAVTC